MFFPLLGLFDMLLPEAATRYVLWQKVFLKISQNSLEKTCVGVSFLNAGLKSFLYVRVHTQIIH